MLQEENTIEDGGLVRKRSSFSTAKDVSPQVTLNKKNNLNKKLILRV